MELLESLPILDELEAEVIKNFDMVSDVLCSHLNKRIEILNLLRDDLTKWTRNKLKGSDKWEIIPGGWVYGYPRLRNRQITKFREDIFDLGYGVDIRDKSRNSLGFSIELMGFLSFSAGQWEPYGKESPEILFKLDDLKQIRERFTKKNVDLEIYMYYTGTEYENSDLKSGKYIGFTVQPSLLGKKEQVVNYYHLFIDEILEPLFKIAL